MSALNIHWLTLGEIKLRCSISFAIDPREWKEKTGWATSNAFEIDVVAVTEKKAHVLMRNCRRLRDDGSLIEEASAFYAFKITGVGWKMYAFSDITFPV